MGPVVGTFRAWLKPAKCSKADVDQVAFNRDFMSTRPSARTGASLIPSDSTLESYIRFAPWRCAAFDYWPPRCTTSTCGLWAPSLSALITSSTVLRAPLGSRQPGDIGRNVPCFVLVKRSAADRWEAHLATLQPQRFGLVDLALSETSLVQQVAHS
jgi:hypothetical protein